MVEQQASTNAVPKNTLSNINFCPYRITSSKEKHLPVEETVIRPMCMHPRMGGENFNSNSCIDITNLGQDNCPIIANG